jgi:hypothetical protein
MKKIITLCTAAAMLLCAAAQAQRGDTPEQYAYRLTRQMDKTLKLSKQQKEKVLQINFTYAEKQHELKQRRDAEEINTNQYHQDILQLVADRNNDLKEVLSSSQYNIYMEYDNTTRKSIQQEKKRQQQEKKRQQQEARQKK